jgi:NO-binding membrane sensor protein with MHYT domain
MESPLEVHHFAHGWFNPAMAYSLAFLGSLLGLGCTARARRADGAGWRRAQWLLLAAVAIGGAAIWLMHFMAMLGFAVPGSEVRYDPWLTGLSMMIAVVTVGAGLFVSGMGRVTVPRLLGGGLLTGCGVAAMHYTGMAAVRLPGRISYEPRLVAASVVIAVIAATVALWFTVSLRRDGHLGAAALVMAAAISGMHYTGMAAVQVAPDPTVGQLPGVDSIMLLIPITVVTAAVLLATAVTALRAMTMEEFADSAPLPPTEATGSRSVAGSGW